MNRSRTSVLVAAIAIVGAAGAAASAVGQSDPTALPVTIRTELVRQWACEALPGAANQFQVHVRIAVTLTSTAAEPVFLDNWVVHAVAARAATTLEAGRHDYDFAKTASTIYTKLEIPPHSTIRREETLVIPIAPDSTQTTMPGPGVLFVQPVASSLLMRGRGTRSVALKGVPHRINVVATPAFDAECEAPRPSSTRAVR